MEAMKLHQEAIVVDGHCDTLLELYTKKRSFWEENSGCQLDWHLARSGKINLQFIACFLEPQYKPFGALSRILELLDYFHFLQEEGRKNGQYLEIIRSREDLSDLSPADFKVLLAIEGGEALEGRLSNLRILYGLGFRSITLTWNQRNEIADGVAENEGKGGLTNFGKEVVREMNRLGMLIDVSHLNEAGFWDVLSLSTKPLVASHSCCRSLCNHPRNLTNSQLKALQENGGVIGINFYPNFLGSGELTIENVIEHIEYAAEIAGIDHVGLGSDFDGIDTVPKGLENAAKLPTLTELLLKRGWKDSELIKVLGGNFIRVLDQVLS
ncbi:MAG: dipeptidase [Peptococcia bacterium]